MVRKPLFCTKLSSKYARLERSPFTSVVALSVDPQLFQKGQEQRSADRCMPSYSLYPAISGRFYRPCLVQSIPPYMVHPSCHAFLILSLPSPTKFHALLIPLMTQTLPPLQLPPLQDSSALPRPNSRQKSMAALTHEMRRIISISRAAADLDRGHGWRARWLGEDVDDGA